VDIVRSPQDGLSTLFSYIPQLKAPTFVIVLGAVALAAATAFGWGARNFAKDIVEGYSKRRDEAKGDAG